MRLRTVPGGMSRVDGDLGVVEPDDVAQHEGGAEVGREGAEGVLDVVRQALAASAASGSASTPTSGVGQVGHDLQRPPAGAS